jgi:hypothetical protein
MIGTTGGSAAIAAGDDSKACSRLQAPSGHGKDRAGDKSNGHSSNCGTSGRAKGLFTVARIRNVSGVDGKGSGALCRQVWEGFAPHAECRGR